MTRKERFGKYAAGGNVSPPLGLLYVAAVLERAGHEVKVLDGLRDTLGHAEVLDLIADYRPDIVGMTIATVQFYRARAIATAVKERFPGMPIVVGGPDVPARLDIYRSDLRSYDFDYAVVGEGETTAVELLEAIQGQRSFDSVKGLIYAEGDEIRATPPREYEEDLDAIPFAAYHLLNDLEGYRPHLLTYRRRPWVTMVTSRGCPFQCTFCDRSVFGRKHRVRSARNIFDEIMMLREKYGIREVSFVDDTFTIKKERVLELCDLLINSKINLIWSCNAHANTLNREMILRMRKAGCWLINLGIESGDDGILKSIAKGITTAQVERVVNWGAEAGIHMRGFFMLGHPGETHETMEKTISFAHKLKLCAANFDITSLFPNTKLTEVAPQYGTVNIQEFVTQYSDDSLTFVAHGFTADELRAAQKRAYLSFYLRPRVVWALLNTGGSLADLKALFLKIMLGFSLVSRLVFSK